MNNQRRSWVPTSARVRKRLAARRLHCEVLEDRLTPTLFNAQPVTDGLATSLRAAISAANADGNADSDVIELSAGTFAISMGNAAVQDNANLRGDFDIVLGTRAAANTLTIQGQGIGVTIVDAGQLDRAFQVIGATTHVVFQNMTIRNGLALDDGTQGAAPGQAFGGAIFSEGPLDLQNVSFLNNEARGVAANAQNQFVAGNAAGGAIFYKLGNSTTISGGNFDGNIARGGAGSGNAFSLGGSARGGSVYSQSGSLTVQNSSVTNSSALAGTSHDTSSSGFNFGREAEGGGIAFNSGQVLTVTNSAVTGNTARGGDFFGLGSDTAGDGNGGGIYVGGNAAQVNITLSTIANNIARGGGGGEGSEGTGARDGDGRGGGLFLDFNNTGTVTTTTFENNSALSGFLNQNAPRSQGFGGGIFTSSSSLTVQFTLLSNNFADTDGGGIFNQGTEAVIDSTISGNRARNNGGGILETVTDTTNLRNTTISNNRADSDADGNGNGGGTFSDFGRFNVYSTIIAGNFDDSPLTAVKNNDVGSAQTGTGGFVSQGFNLIGDTTGSTAFTNGVNHDQVGTMANPVPPGLDPLANNGGPTKTQALQFNSLAIDKGDNALLNLATDQRTTGFPRTQRTATDVGAFELPGIDLAIAKDDGLMTVTAGQVLTYFLLIQNVGIQGTTGVLVTDTLPAGMAFVSASDGGVVASGVVTWPTFSLAAGASVSRTVKVQVRPVGASGAFFLNTAHVTDDGHFGPDLNLANNTAQDTDHADPPIVPPPPTNFPILQPTIASKVQLLSSTFGPNGTTSQRNVLFVNHLYNDVLGRAADQDGLNNWILALDGGMSYAAVALNFYLSAEHRALQVSQFYLAFLDRPADPSGEAYYVKLMLGGASEADISRKLLTSDEYMAAHGSDAAYVNGLYVDVLGRQADPGELGPWLTQLQSGQTRDAVANAFLFAAEAESNAVPADYNNFLKRGPDDAERAMWLAQLQSGRLSYQDLAVIILSSTEYVNRGV